MPQFLQQPIKASHEKCKNWKFISLPKRAEWLKTKKTPSLLGQFHVARANCPNTTSVHKEYSAMNNVRTFKLG